MPTKLAAIVSLCLAASVPLVARAADQTVPGAGNAAAAKLAAASPLVRSALRHLQQNAERVRDAKLHHATVDALFNPSTCIAHRAGVDAAGKSTILDELLQAGLYAPTDAANFPGGALAGVFPPVLSDGTSCPQLPQPFGSAPGSVFGGHHSYPGGLPIHETFNDISDLHLAAGYRQVYGNSRGDGLPEIGEGHGGDDITIDEDIILAAPLWHDWAKPLVFQWNSDGSEFAEFNFGGNGATDNNGAAGDSRTGAHHIIGVAETMKRGLSAELVITQASAHSSPTSGNEYKVVNWLRAAAIIARIDPIAAGYLTKDAAGHYRLPAVQRLGDVDLLAAGQSNILAEYELHNLSDADFTLTGPAVAVVQVLLKQLAPELGFDPTDVARYNTAYRNPALSYLSAERLLIKYGRGGLGAVRAELRLLRKRGII
jgi:hypothetical protein